MKKIGIWVIGAALILSSCDTYTGQGAYVGGTFGSILGSAIGGIAGGWRGSDIGTIVGMAGGAAVGAAIGAQADKAEAEKYEAYKRDREQRRAERLPRNAWGCTPFSYYGFSHKNKPKTPFVVTNITPLPRVIP